MYIVANWKENFTIAEAERWIGGLNKELRIKNKGNVEIVVCPPFVLLPLLHSSFTRFGESPLADIRDSSFSLGAQDVSRFEEGQYTGEVSAKMLKDFVDYVIVGHSERRRHFGETDEDVALKIEQCLKHGPTPIVCVSKLKEVLAVSIVSGASRVIFAYEPLEAVGTGEPDKPENAQGFAEKVKSEVGQNVKVLYGGSVNAKNAKSFVEQPDIDGVLVGQASLDPEEFSEIVRAS